MPSRLSVLRFFLACVCVLGDFNVIGDGFNVGGIVRRTMASHCGTDLFTPRTAHLYTLQSGTVTTDTPFNIFNMGRHRNGSIAILPNPYGKKTLVHVLPTNS